MNGLDYVIIAIVGLSALVGLLRGFTKEALSLVTWSGAGMTTYILFPVAKGFTLHYIFSLLANSLSGFVRNSSLSGVDRGLGIGFGALRGLVLVCAAEIVFTTFTPRDKQSATILKAKFIYPVRNGSDQLMAILPTHVRNYVNAQSHGLNKPMKDHMKDQMQKALPDGTIPGMNPGQSLAPGADSAETGVLVAMPQLPGFGVSTPGQSAQTVAPPVQSVPQDSKAMMESLAQLKIRNEEVLDEKAAGETKYNSHELDRLVTVANDEDKVKTMPKTASPPPSSNDGEEDHDPHEDHEED
jgi:membrane protein required for colicin V production